MGVRWFRFEHLHGPEGFWSPGFLAVDEAGLVVEVTPQRPAADAIEQVPGYAIAGLPNLHGHAFQRAMAGLAERASASQRGDSFWTWREVMYDLSLRISPEQVEAVAAQLYVEMLEAGFTSAAEFHYLHHAPDGSPYDDPSELGQRVLAAADQAGLSLSMLPVFYAHAGVGKPLSPRQRRFGHRDVTGYAVLFEGLSARVRGTRHRMGVAPHSLRAVSHDELTALLELAHAHGPDTPVHIHIAEQTAEVDEIRAALGTTPIAWLLDHAPVDARFCLVHATHASDDECTRMARSGAVVGLCPYTEANLGDGIFPLRHYADQAGAFGVGTDSHVRVSAAAELSMVEYPQRLVHRARNVLAELSPPAHLSTGQRLYETCLAGGARALGLPVSGLTVGMEADLVVLDARHPRLLGHDVRSLFDAYVFSAGESVVRQVMTRGSWVVKDGRHVRRDEIARSFEHAMHALWSQV